MCVHSVNLNLEYGRSDVRTAERDVGSSRLSVDHSLSIELRDLVMHLSHHLTHARCSPEAPGCLTLAHNVSQSNIALAHIQRVRRSCNLHHLALPDLRLVASSHFTALMRRNFSKASSRIT